MDHVIARFSQFLNDDRLLANLIGVHVALAAVMALSFFVRYILLNSGERFLKTIGWKLLDGLTDEAARGIRSLVFWSTLGLMFVTVVGGIAYHAAGHDVRTDSIEWYRNLTTEQLVRMGLNASKLLAIVVGAVLCHRLARRLLLRIERHIFGRLREATTVTTIDDEARPVKHESLARRWFSILHRCSMLCVVLASSWLVGHTFSLGGVLHSARFAARIAAIVMFARLATLAFQTTLLFVAAQGSRHLAQGKFRRYWERVTRLFVFAQKCFESAVYVIAASQSIKILSGIIFFEIYGNKIVACIGIFFGTRVVIELLHVLLSEAFGMFDEERSDQKGQTLVPLLNSILQYVLYFGSALMMLQTLEINITPILAGVSILGLGVGLGAQSLVTDVVSGFFILFENQFLVGDVVEIGSAVGRVEAVAIRTTQIRDEFGKLHIIPNGQIRNVVNYSKTFVNAVVDIRVPTSTNVEQVMRDMSEAGKRLRQSRREVLAETVIKGLVDLTPSDMVIRAVTKVAPGSHQAMQNEYRRLLKEVFDQRQTGRAAA